MPVIIGALGTIPQEPIGQLNILGMAHDLELGSAQILLTSQASIFCWVLSFSWQASASALPATPSKFI